MSSSTHPWWHNVSKRQWLLLVVAWLGWMFDIMDTALFAFAKVPMLTEMLGGKEAYKLHGPGVEGAIMGVFYLGWSVGGLVFGVMADRFGRVRTMVVTILLYTAFTGLTAACQTWEQVAVLRFLTALGIGGEWAAGTALVAEAFPDKSRAPASSLLQSAAAFGPAAAALVNLAIPAAHWRWLFLVGVVPAAITVVIRAGVAEPERWTKAQRTGSLVQPLADLFGQRVWRRHAFVALALGVVGIAGAMNVTYWLPNLVNSVSAGLGPDAIQHRMSVATLTLHVGTLIGVMLMPWMCERIGRKAALLVFFVAGPLSMLLATWGGGTYARLLALAPLMSLFTIGVSAGYVLYFPELFPTRLRATGAGFAYNVGRVASSGFPLLTASLMLVSGSVAGGVAQTAVLVALVGALALPFAPETRGKPLPDC